MAIQFPPRMIESLKEMIMEDHTVEMVVDAYATKCMEHFFGYKGMTESMSPNQEEMFCQYQNQAWNQLFLQIALL